MIGFKFYFSHFYLKLQTINFRLLLLMPQQSQKLSFIHDKAHLFILEDHLWVTKSWRALHFCLEVLQQSNHGGIAKF
jgi:hypothetical protein